MFQAGGYEEVVSAAQVEGAVFKFKGGGSFEEGDPFRVFLIIPKSRRACGLVGPDEFHAEGFSLEDRRDDFMGVMPGGRVQ